MLPGDRWRRAHDIFKMHIYQDMKFLGLIAQKEVYGLFKRFHNPEGKDKYDSLNNNEKKLQTIVPDVVTSNHPEGSPIATNGDQMWEIKRLHSSTSFTKQGASKGLNEYYCQRQSTPFVRAADQRAKKVPKEYEAKAKKADEILVHQGALLCKRPSKPCHRYVASPWELLVSLANPSTY